MSMVEVKVPDIGDFKEVEVIELLVQPGDTITAEQSLLTVESDKASMEIPSSHGGVVRELRVKLGDKVAEGTVVLVLETAAAEAGAAPAPAAAAPAAAAPAPASASSSPAAAPAPAAAAAAPPAAAEPVTVLVPDIGDFDEVAVIEVFVKIGDGVKVEQSLITVESDKASMEIPSSHAGSVTQVLVKVGDKVKKGSPILVLTAAATAPASAPAAASAPTPAQAPSMPPAPVPASAPASAPGAAAAAVAATAPPAAGPTAAAPAPAAHEPTAAPGARLPHASPSIRRMARELGVPLAEVKGSGPNGRITQSDLQGFVKGVMAGEAQTVAQTAAQKAKAPPAAPAAAAGGAFPGLLAWPQVDFAKFGAIERKDLSRIKKISGANLHRNWVLIPHVTNNDEADITELEAFRVRLNQENEKSGVKITMLAFVIKAVVAALKKFPDFNASLDGDALVYKKYFHVGFAADTPNGLVVPVLKDADRKGVLQISQEMGELAKKARDGKLGPADMSGGCISISSLGGIGGTHFTPIINAPEVAILGLSKSAMKPVWDGQAFVPRLVLPLSLSYDHRVIDGASASRFNAYLGQILADFRRVLL
jgi:pyruvate dehydrogenase E2 component (dihydrolipoamide acetyltransferase)